MHGAHHFDFDNFDKYRFYNIFMMTSLHELVSMCTNTFLFDIFIQGVQHRGKKHLVSQLIVFFFQWLSPKLLIYFLLSAIYYFVMMKC